MNRKVFGIAAAVALALIGTVLLVSYVRQAEERALAGEELVEVYVVGSTIPAGSSGEDIEEFVRVETVPVKVQATGSVQSLASLEGRVAAVDLVPGEQLVGNRFVERSEFANREVGVSVPPGMVEITMKLEPQRAVGGLVAAGDTVAVIASFEPFDLKATVVEVDGEEVALPQAVAAEIDGTTPNTSHLILHKVLVTAVQEDFDSSGLGGDEDDAADRLKTAPEGDLLVTLAVEPANAERLVFTKEFGTVWLAAERNSVSDADIDIQTRGSVYDDIEPVRSASR